MRTRALSALVAATALATAVWPLQRTSAQLTEPPVPSVAPGYRAPNVAPSGAQIIGVTQQPFVGISLQDAIAMALPAPPAPT